MNSKQQFIGLTIFFALLGIALVVTSLATDHWVESHPELKVNISDSQNSVHFGLFKGFKSLNYIFGDRETVLEVVCDASFGACSLFSTDRGDPGYNGNTEQEYLDSLKNRSESSPLHTDGLFSYSMWVTTIAAAAVSVIFGLVSTGFAVFNVLGKPIETITGPLGLYLWNSIAFLFSLLEMVIFLALYLTAFSKNFLSPVDASKFDTELTNLGYSFYLSVGAVVMYLINIIILFCSGYKLRCAFSTEAEKVVDNGMILY